ncbi:hypothetical protein QBC39DRAFT_73662 [Podospora conica]|nr:hypothetical protein QBC39DRAFT_73662 [Schizothecium conicum]
MRGGQRQKGSRVPSPAPSQHQTPSLSCACACEPVMGHHAARCRCRSLVRCPRRPSGLRTVDRLDRIQWTLTELNMVLVPRLQDLALWRLGGVRACRVTSVGACCGLRCGRASVRQLAVLPRQRHLALTSQRGDDNHHHQIETRRSTGHHESAILQTAQQGWELSMSCPHWPLLDAVTGHCICSALAGTSGRRTQGLKTAGQAIRLVNRLPVWPSSVSPSRLLTIFGCRNPTGQRRTRHGQLPETDVSSWPLCNAGPLLCSRKGRA